MRLNSTRSQGKQNYAIIHECIKPRNELCRLLQTGDWQGLGFTVSVSASNPRYWGASKLCGVYLPTGFTSLSARAQTVSKATFFIAKSTRRALRRQDYPGTATIYQSVGR
jgi:hypothetical protein